MMYKLRLGKIVEYFPDTQSATIQLLEQSIFGTETSNFNAAKIAPLEDVPVRFLKVGNFSITLPVKKDDVCLVKFFDRGITPWLYEGREEYAVNNGRPEPAAMRKHSISDAVAEIGLSNFLNPISDFQANDMELRNIDRSQRITFKFDKSIEVESTNDGTVKTLVQMKPDGTVTISCTEEVTVNCKRATVNADEKLDINTPKANFSGEIRAEGDISSGGDLKTDSKGGFNGHKHKAGDYKDGQSKPVTGNSGTI